MPIARLGAPLFNSSGGNEMAETTEYRASDLRPKLTLLHIIRAILPVAAAVCVLTWGLRVHVGIVLLLTVVTWLVVRATTKRVLRSVARALWRYGRWRGIRLEGGWYTLWRAADDSVEQERIAQEILREYPAQADQQLRAEVPAADSH